MKKTRKHISTTISPKHWELLKKYTEKFETQQKVLESALELMESSSNSKHIAALSPEEEMQMYIIRELKYNCMIPREALKALIEFCDYERLSDYISQSRWLEFMMEIQYKKNLKQCSLKEIMDGIIICARMCNWFDSVNYTDDGDHYTLTISHTLGLNGSKLNKVYIESMFKTYGAKTESEISERSIFMKIYKN